MDVDVRTAPGWAEYPRQQGRLRGNSGGVRAHHHFWRGAAVARSLTERQRRLGNSMPLRLAVASALATSTLAATGLVLIPVVALAATQAVAIQGTSPADFAYVPGNPALTTGDAVHWTNNSTVSHTVTRCDNANCPLVGAGSGTGPAAFNSGTLPGGGAGSFNQVFDGAGTYNYYCAIHGYSVMHGTVSVAAAASAATPSPSPSTTTSTRLPPSGAGPEAVGSSPRFPASGLVVASLLVLVAGSAATAGFFVRRRSR